MYVCMYFASIQNKNCTWVCQTQKLLHHESLTVYFRASAESLADFTDTGNCQNIDGISDSSLWIIDQHALVTGDDLNCQIWT